MSNVVNDMDEPLSPDSQAYVDNYSPSKESPSMFAFIGRRRLRIINGQDPSRVRTQRRHFVAAPVRNMIHKGLS